MDKSLFLAMLSISTLPPPLTVMAMVVMTTVMEMKRVRKSQAVMRTLMPTKSTTTI